MRVSVAPVKVKPVIDHDRIASLREHVFQLQTALEGIANLMSEIVSPERMTRRQVATYLDVSTKTIDRWQRSRQFPQPKSDGLYDRDEVEEWIDDPKRQG